MHFKDLLIKSSMRNEVNTELVSVSLILVPPNSGYLITVS